MRIKGLRRPLDICFWAGLTLAGMGTVRALWPAANVDRDFFARVPDAAFRRGPSVLFDEGHWNAVSVHGAYAPFAQLIRRDGYRLFRNRQEFVPELLAQYDTLAIVDPLGLLGRPAVDLDEIQTVQNWVRSGGALLLVAGTGQAGMAARPLAEAFGVKMTGTTLEDPKVVVLDHPITRGRPGKDEDLRRVRTYGGQSLAGPRAQTFLALPSGEAQGIAVEFGKGRVVVMGDSTALTAQLIRGERRGVNQTEADNRQMVLNIMHWLSRLI